MSTHLPRLKFNRFPPFDLSVLNIGEVGYSSHFFTYVEAPPMIGFFSTGLIFHDFTERGSNSTQSGYLGVSLNVEAYDGKHDLLSVFIYFLKTLSTSFSLNILVYNLSLSN